MARLVVCVPGGKCLRYRDNAPQGVYSRPEAGWDQSRLESDLAGELDRMGATQLRVSSARVDEAPLAPFATGTVVLNACGTVDVSLSPVVEAKHVAWQRRSTLFGWEDQAYTVAGNLSLQYRRVTFKGANDPARLAAVAANLLSGAATSVPRLKLSLVVMQTRLGKALLVSKWCLLETKIREFAWARDRDRIEELCNTALFGIGDWGLMLRELGIKPFGAEPSSATVSVTRRGVMTIRLTWAEPGMDWGDNVGLKLVGDSLGVLVARLV